MRETTARSIRYRLPVTKDGSEAWKLVRDSGGLDLNSEYSYLMLCDLFRDTCRIAECEGKLVGFVSAFRKPGDSRTLFVWQIAVDPGLRGYGIGKKLLLELLGDNAHAEIRFLEATIGPRNIPSRRLFLGLSQSLGAECSIASQYGSELFAGPESHEDELLFRIGPIGREGTITVTDQPQRMEGIGQ